MNFPGMLQIPVVELPRLEEHNSFGTFGVMKINKSVFCVTLEPPDKLNKPFVSSIPAQQYMCVRIKSPKYGETFKVMNVPGRNHVEFHAGNDIDDTEGCIILAEHFGKLKGNRAVLNSGRTFRNFMSVMEGIKFFHLTIQEHY